MKLLNPKPVEKPMQTMAWRPFFGAPPEGVGDTPKLYDDGYWYVKQHIGAGWYQHRGLPNDPTSTAAMDGDFDQSMVGRPRRSHFGTIGDASRHDLPTLLQTASSSNQDSQLDYADREAFDKAYRDKVIALRNAVPTPTLGVGYETEPSEDANQADWDNAYRQHIIAKRSRVAFGSTRILRYGLGAHAALPNPNNRAEISAADDLLAYFDTNSCTRASIPVVVAFQNAYNASGLPGKLTVDGQYGGNTQKAVQNVLDEAQADAGAGPSQGAPTNCFNMSIPSVPGLDPVPSGGGGSGTTTTPTVVVTGTPRNWTPWIIGGAVAAGTGIVGYAYYKKHKRGYR